MSVTVTLGMTSWNQGMRVLPFTLGSMRAEMNLLKRFGYRSHGIVVDNKSTDGTAEYLATQRGIDVTQVPSSCGVSFLRNHLVGGACLLHSDYVVLVDGDVGLIPHSVVAMVRYLHDHPLISAIAMDPLGQTPNWEDSTSYCTAIKKTRADALMYLCGYGVFRRSIFDTVQFEESGPFAGPGWGSEDDDFYLQMVEAGMSAVYVEGYRFHHGTPRSSWPSLRAIGVDPLVSFEVRRNYLLQKWREKRPQRVHSGHLNMIGGQQLHA